jgi:hypothetical protein
MNNPGDLIHIRIVSKAGVLAARDGRLMGRSAGTE